ncbi:MAG: hypothetical protein K2N78_10555 [Oscillospiraceae bacterium]|nr:hypothetical protein [Oscillospiraceae bacterium]
MTENDKEGAVKNSKNSESRAIKFRRRFSKRDLLRNFLRKYIHKRAEIVAE